jgi:hypothetical protein
MAPFGKAAALLSELLPLGGAQHASTVRSRTLRVGAEIVQANTAEAADRPAVQAAAPSWPALMAATCAAGTGQRGAASRWSRARSSPPMAASWMRRRPVRDVVGVGKARQHVADLLGYLERNEAALAHYAARRRRGEPIATAFVESAVDEIISWRMAKARQVRWSRATVQPFLDVRTTVLNDTLELAFRRRHPGFRPANDDHKLAAAAA